MFRDTYSLLALNYNLSYFLQAVPHTQHLVSAADYVPMRLFLVLYIFFFIYSSYCPTYQSEALTVIAMFCAWHHSPSS